MKKSVIGIGNALVDILTKIDDDNILKELNLPKGSMQLVDREMSDRIGELLSGFESSMAPGGSSANTIHDWKSWVFQPVLYVTRVTKKSEPSSKMP